MNKHLIMITMVLIFTIVSGSIVGCAQADSIYKTFSDSYELSDDELKALTEGQLSLNLEDTSSLNGEFDSPNISSKLGNLGVKAKTGVYNLISRMCTWFKTYGIYVAAISAFVGIVIMRLARKSINIRRKALFILVLGIPIFTVVMMYGSAFLCDALR